MQTSKPNVSLQAKIGILVSTLIITGLAGIIYLNAVAHEKSVLHEVRDSSRTIAHAVYNGIMFAMSQGDGEAVQKELEELKESLNGGEIFIFGHNKRTATFTSEKEKEGTDLTKEARSAELAMAIDELVRTGKTADHDYTEWVNGKPFLTMLLPLTHQERCKECHAGAEDVHGGGIMIRQNLDAMYGNITKQTYNNIITGTAGCLMIIVLLNLAIAKLVIRPMSGTITNLSQKTDRVLRSAALVASASQILAEGATEQAASIEETSASLTEMSAMTRQNAESADGADTLLQEVRHAVGRANEDMAGLARSMTEISLASTETAKIIKTIDEIAFQTKLLALNAAVEAARAGEAGMGFAVVANEVKGLALRAEEAAKSTETLIEGTGRKVREGAELVGRTDAAFTEVAKCTAKACSLVDEIVTASKEQSQGIDQISGAMAQIEAVVQHNAAGAEESSAASEELNHLATAMQGVVQELTDIVGHSPSTAVARTAAKTARPSSVVREHEEAMAALFRQGGELRPTLGLR